MTKIEEMQLQACKSEAGMVCQNNATSNAISLTLGPRLQHYRDRISESNSSIISSWQVYTFLVWNKKILSIC